jgi:hypothetical protein
MNSTKFKIGEYRPNEVEWANGWAIIVNPGLFAAKFNSVVKGVYRQVTVDDIRYMAQCGLIGRYGFFTRQDMEIVRGILRYEQLRKNETEQKKELELVHARSNNQTFL